MKPLLPFLIVAIASTFNPGELAAQGGKGDTLSTLMIMAGAAVYELNRLDPGEGNVISVLFIVIKIMLIGGFIMLTSPTRSEGQPRAEPSIPPTNAAPASTTVGMAACLDFSAEGVMRSLKDFSLAIEV